MATNENAARSAHVRQISPQLVRTSGLVIRLGSATQLVFVCIYFGIGAIAAYRYPQYLWPTANYGLFVSLALGLVNFFCVWARPYDRWTAIPYALGAALCFEAIYSNLIRVDRALYAWEPTLILTIAMLGAIIVAGAWIPFHLIIVWKASLQKRVELASQAPQRVSRARITSALHPHPVRRPRWASISIMAITIVSGLGILQAYYPFVPLNRTVTIDPADTPVEFLFWGSLHDETYSTGVKEQLNNHSAIIVGYDNPWLQNEATFASDRDAWVAEMLLWKSQYPRVRFMVDAVGIPGAFVWDGSAAGTIALIKTYAGIIVANSLTNVIGFNTDQEEPYTGTLEETARDRARHQAATDAWNAFFDEVAHNATLGAFEYQTTFGGESVLDAYDGDNDLDVYMRNNILDVPGWDEYAPMYYFHGDDVNGLPGPISADVENYNFYLWMNVLADGLASKGLGSKIGVYLGITGLGIMCNTTLHTVNGQAAGYGYDALVTQARIAKAFNPKRLSIYMLNTVPWYGRGITQVGVFDGYGANFLDRFNASINGAGASAPFEIPVVETALETADLLLDVMLDPAWVLYTGIAWVVALTITAADFDFRITRRMVHEADAKCKPGNS